MSIVVAQPISMPLGAAATAAPASSGPTRRLVSTAPIGTLGLSSSTSKAPATTAKASLAPEAAAASRGSLSKFSPSSPRIVYTREELLSLSKSPLAQSPPTGTKVHVSKIGGSDGQLPALISRSPPGSTPAQSFGSLSLHQGTSWTETVPDHSPSSPAANGAAFSRTTTRKTKGFSGQYGSSFGSRGYVSPTAGPAGSSSPGEPTASFSRRKPSFGAISNRSPISAPTSGFHISAAGGGGEQHQQQRPPTSSRGVSGSGSAMGAVTIPATTVVKDRSSSSTTAGSAHSPSSSSSPDFSSHSPSSARSPGTAFNFAASAGAGTGGGGGMTTVVRKISGQRIATTPEKQKMGKGRSSGTGTGGGGTPLSGLSLGRPSDSKTKPPAAQGAGKIPTSAGAKGTPISFAAAAARGVV